MMTTPNPSRSLNLGNPRRNTGSAREATSGSLSVNARRQKMPAQKLPTFVANWRR